MALILALILVFWFFKFDNEKATKFQSAFFLKDVGTTGIGMTHIGRSKMNRFTEVNVMGQSIYQKNRLDLRNTMVESV
jgi:hypothetical protein